MVTVQYEYYAKYVKILVIQNKTNILKWQNMSLLFPILLSKQRGTPLLKPFDLVLQSS